MFLIRKAFHATILAVLLVLLCTSIGSATSISLTGTFTQDDQWQLIYFQVSAPGPVTIQTWSFGGTGSGTNFEGESIPAGGFYPVLTVFDPSLNLVGGTPAYGGCPPSAGCQVDSDTGVAMDAFVELDGLSNGTYLLVLTEFHNLPNGSDWASGFSQYQAGNFTQEAYGYPGGPSAPFLYVDGSKRTGNWAVDLSGVDAAGEVPEPGSLALLAAGLLLLLAPRLFRLRRHPKT